MNLHNLPRVIDRISFIYIEHAKINQKDNAFTVTREDGTYTIPVAQYLVLLLGPGTSITHSAINLLSKSGTTAIWTQSNITKTLAVLKSNSLSNSSKAIEKQAKAFADKRMHLAIARKMYQKRFPNEDFTGLSVDKMRGKEGFRMKQVYKFNANKYGVKWYGRDYDLQDFDNSDLINQNLTTANQILYGVCSAVIQALGFSTALGFIHVGLANSFVYDISDLYKAEISIPLAFEATKYHSNVKDTMSKKIHDTELIKRIVKDLFNLFDIHEPLIEVLYLWDNIQDSQEAGINFDSANH